MARKSRKENLFHRQEIVEIVYKTAIYLRLSKDDLQKEQGNTLAMQEELIRDYLKDKPEFLVEKVYQDSGFTGTHFVRPQFQMMMEDVKSGCITAIVVKDLSRFGRNYMEVGEYLGKIFPFLGLRFIAINDGYDNFSSNFSDELIMHLLNITNDLYARDISAKITPTLKSKQLRGEFLGPFPVYGYARNQKKPEILLIDQEVSQNVVKIFTMKANGLGNLKIAQALTEQNIPSPSAYRFAKGICTQEKYKNCPWNVSTIKSLLGNQTFLGHTVSGKTRVSLAEGKISTRMKVEDWTVVKNTHEALISEELFQQVGDIMSERRAFYLKKRSITEKPPSKSNLFQGILFCGHCQKPLYQKNVTIVNSAGEQRKVAYYRHDNSSYAEKCVFSSIKNKFLTEKVFDRLQKYLDNSHSSDLNLNEPWLQAEKQKQKYPEIHQISFYKMIKNVNKTKQENFVSYLEGRITQEDYLILFENQQKKLTQLEDDLRRESNETPLSPEGKVLSLTPELLQKYISKIEVFSHNSIEILFFDNYCWHYEQL